MYIDSLWSPSYNISDAIGVGNIPDLKIKLPGHISFIILENSKIFVQKIFDHHSDIVIRTYVRVEQNGVLRRVARRVLAGSLGCGPENMSPSQCIVGLYTSPASYCPSMCMSPVYKVAFDENSNVMIKNHVMKKKTERQMWMNMQ